MKINKHDEKVIDLASKKIAMRKGPYSTVAAALKTKSGKYFVGVNIEQIHSSPCSMCAEYSAIGQMQSDDDHEIEVLVALRADGTVLPPCGKCREMLKQFGNPYVILMKGDEIIKVRLEELIPFWELK